MDATTEQDLRDGGSLKWTAAAEGVIAAWIAEMDLPPAAAVTDAVTAAVQRGLTGYLPTWVAQECADATAAWHRRYGRTVDPADVHLVADVLTGLQITVNHLMPGAAPIVLPVPAYMPFLDLPSVVDRTLITVPMAETNGRFALDLDEIAAVLSPGALFLLTNPHNPTGRVLSREELVGLAEVVHAAGAFVFADEIHAPLVHAGHRHVCYATVSPAAATHTVTATSASKGWNVPGLCCAQLIIEPGYRGGSWEDVPMIATHGASPLGAVAATAAYTAGAEHLAACLEYINAGAELFAAELARELPAAKFTPPEGTYLGWVDLRGTGLDSATLPDTVGVQGVDGTSCGAPGFLRVNLATPHHLLTEIAHRLGRAGTPA